MSAARRARAPRKPLVLAVDDDPLVLDLIEGFLDDLEVRTTRGSREARMVLEAARPDLVLLDINMPGGDGLELLGWIRRKPELNETPVMMLTARADRGTVRQAIESGADGYMVKPFTGKNLARRTKHLVNCIRLSA